MMLFLTLMVVGLAGLTLMALPGISRRGGTHGTHGLHSGGHGHAHGHLHFHAPKAGHHVAGAKGGAGVGQHATSPHAAAHAAAGSTQGSGGFVELVSHLIPEPRAILSLLTLYGASGYVLQAGFHLSHLIALFAALVPAVALEVAVVGPLWRFALKFQGKEASPLEWLLAENATAVTPFRNGRGIVKVEHDGRIVQLSARLIAEHADQSIRVGDVLRIEDVDTAAERVTVSLNTTPLTRT